MKKKSQYTVGPAHTLTSVKLLKINELIFHALKKTTFALVGVHNLHNLNKGRCLKHIINDSSVQDMLFHIYSLVCHTKRFADVELFPI